MIVAKWLRELCSNYILGRHYALYALRSTRSTLYALRALRSTLYALRALRYKQPKKERAWPTVMHKRHSHPFFAIDQNSVMHGTLCTLLFQILQSQLDCGEMVERAMF